jgi:hypothetical protein
MFNFSEIIFYARSRGYSYEDASLMALVSYIVVCIARPRKGEADAPHE